MGTEAPTFIARKFDQVCFVVEDLDAAIEYWSRTNGIEHWDKAIDLAKQQTDKEYWGKPGNFEFSCAYGAAGDVIIELAHHDGGDSLYKDWLDEGGRGPHHIGFRLDDAEECAQAEAVYSAAGLTKAMGGFFEADSGTCRWSYWDTREQIGCYTELYYVAGPALERISRFLAGEAISLTR